MRKTDPDLAFDDDLFTGEPDEPDDDEDALETARSLKYARRMDRADAKRIMVKALHSESLASLFPTLPDHGTSCHVVNNGKSDFWALVPHLLTLTGPAYLWASTWILNRNNALELLDLLDTGKLLSTVLLSGTYFKNREPAVYAVVAEGFLLRHQRFLAFQNHAKIICLINDTAAIVVEGSANFTANPRLEQYVLTHDRSLAEFHKSWMEEMIRHGHTAERGRGWRPT